MNGLWIFITKTWIAQGRFMNMIHTPSKQWGMCDKHLRHTMTFVIIMVADVLLPNRRQAISNHHAVSSATTCMTIMIHITHIMQCAYCVKTILLKGVLYGRSATCWFLHYCLFEQITLYGPYTYSASVDFYVADFKVSVLQTNSIVIKAA